MSLSLMAPAATTRAVTGDTQVPYGATVGSPSRRGASALGTRLRPDGSIARHDASLGIEHEDGHEKQEHGCRRERHNRPRHAELRRLSKGGAHQVHCVADWVQPG